MWVGNGNADISKDVQRRLGVHNLVGRVSGELISEGCNDVGWVLHKINAHDFAFHVIAICNSEVSGKPFRCLSVE
jgi:hypothetical protein